MSSDSKNLHSLYTVGLVFLGFFFLFYLLHLNSVMWNPWIYFSGREVSQGDVHKLGVNAFYFRDEVKAFTGSTVKKESDSDQILYRTYFRDGMIHHREILEPTLGIRIMRISFLNEKVVQVEFWDRQGQFFGQAEDQASILERIKELGYERFYNGDPL